MLKLASQIIIEILQNRMSLEPNSIWLRDQNRLIPNDKGLYIVVGFVNSVGITSNNTYMTEEVVGEETIQHEINEVQVMENIQIDILSRSNDALTRNWEIIAVLQSFYSQQLQEEYNFKIFRIPRAFLNTSSSEGGSTLNRYTITVTALVWHRKESLLASPLGDYYNDFTQRVDDEQTIGTDTPLIEFEINSGGIVP